MSAFSLKTWINKGFTEEEARYQVAIRRPTNIEYYLNKNMSREDAEKALRNFQSRSGSVFASKSKEEKRKSRTSCIEYYLEKGYSLEEATQLRSERQKTFSKEICIEKHGVDEGTRIWEERQTKWQSSINNRSQSELDEINRKKGEWILNLSEEEYTKFRDQKREEQLNYWNNISKEERESYGDEIRQRMIDSGRAIPDDLLDAFHAYKREVWLWTRRNDLSVLDNFDLRGRTSYHLDHKFSITEGFKQGVDAKIIGHIKNLEMMYHKDNISKHTGCSITLDQLLIQIKAHDDQDS